MDRKFDFDDILIMPANLSSINSRYNGINPFYEINDTVRLPLFTAPMDTVVHKENIYNFTDAKINVCLPRTIKNQESLDKPYFTFVSYSLKDFIDKVNKHKDLPSHVLIDIANGHMSSIIEICKKAKRDYRNLTIMVGNIANPETYRSYLVNRCVDYIRVGIGNGGGCLTTQQSGVGYPKASLIHDIKKIKSEYENNFDYNNSIPKIVADGGMKDYSDIVKALALGADYVMLGSVLNKALESAGGFYEQTTTLNYKELDLEDAIHRFDMGEPVYKLFRGMSTKDAQRAMGKKEEDLKTSEGIVTYRKVEYTLKGWVENFEHYLRNAMSYTNSHNLEEFIGKVEFNLITSNAFKRFNK